MTGWRTPQRLPALAALNPRGASLASARARGDLAIYMREAFGRRSIRSGGCARRSRCRAAAGRRRQIHRPGYAYLAVNQKPGRRGCPAGPGRKQFSIKTRFVAGRLLQVAGKTAQARVIGPVLLPNRIREPQSYAKLLEAAISIQSGNAKQAVILGRQPLGLRQLDRSF